MAKTELLKELKGGVSNFIIVGKATIKEDSFSGEIIKEGKTWLHTDSSFGIEYGDGLKTFVKLYGGYKLDNPTLQAFSREGKSMISIDWEDRFDEKVIDTVSPRSLYTARLVSDEDGKLITKQFLNALDFEEYLGENLEDGMDVTVTGNIEYGTYGEGKLSKKYNLRSVYINQEYKRGEEVVPKKDPVAVIRQTFILDDGSLDKGYKKELEKTGETVIAAKVPQYLSSKKVGESYVPYKQVDPILVPLKLKTRIKVDEEGFDKELERTIKIAEQFFKVKKDTVRELGVNLNLIEGYDSSTGEIEISKEMQQLIDAGILSEDDVKSQMTSRGNKVSEYVYIKPIIRAEEGVAKIQMFDDKYAPEALIVSQFDGENDDEFGAGADLFKDDLKDDEKDSKSAMAEKEFDELFVNMD